MPYGYFGFGLLTLAVQVFFAVHAYRNGRPFWIFILFFFPWVGSLVYFFVEFLPEVRARGTIESTARKVAHRLNPAAEIKRLEDQVALSNSLNNRMELARAYLRAGRHDDAVAVYRDSLRGIYADEPAVLYELSAAYYAAGRLDEAREAFERLRGAAPTLSEAHLLLSARIHEDAGEPEAAARDYAALLSRTVAGEEARCRYALLLKRLGRADEAYALFDQIVRHARLSSRHFRRSEKEWIDIAQAELKERETAGQA